jgi:hypothetical protein
MAEVVNLSPSKRRAEEVTSLCQHLIEAESLVLFQERALKNWRLSSDPSSADTRLAVIANTLRLLRSHLGAMKETL